MDNTFQTSFIPKKPINVESPSSGSSVSIFSFISILVLIFSLVASGGLFLYKNYLSQQKNQAEKSLEASKGRFELNTIKTLELFDKKTNLSKQLISNHTVMTPFFNLLGSLTVPYIQYTKFEINHSDKGVAVSMNGVARDYQYIALQAQTFNNAPGYYFKNVVFSDLVKEKNGNVTFKVSLDVEPTLFSYEKLLSDSTNPFNQRDAMPASSGSVNSLNINTNRAPVEVPIPAEVSEVNLNNQ
jgi:hypothetical protein